MKIIQSFETYNKSLRNKLKGKSQDELNNSIKNLPIQVRFVKACEFGIIDIVNELINKVDLSSKWRNFDMIQLASDNGHLNVVKVLMKDGRFDPSLYYNTVINIACSNNYIDIVKELIKDKRVQDKVDINTMEKADITDELTKLLYPYYSKNTYDNNNLKNSYNESLRDKLKGKSKEDILNSIKILSPQEQLNKACEFGIIDIVWKLLKNGADPNFDPNLNQHTPFKLASENNHLDIVKLLLQDKRVDPSDYSNVAIRRAAHNGHINIVIELLKDDRVNPSDYNNEAIRYASLNGHLEVVKELLKDKRVNPSDYNNEAIRYASLNGHLEVVKELLKDKRVNSMINHNELINIAAKKGYTDIVIELLKNGVDPVKFGNISIKQATLYGHTNIVNILRNHMGLNESLRDKLKGKSDEDITNVISDMKPLPLLRRSLESNYSKGIKLAIDKGARFDSTVIVKYSSKEDFYDIVKGLVDNNISLNLDHSYLLHHAVLKKYIDIVNYMISNGVDVNTYGILYSSSGQLEMTKLLLDNGANVNNNNGGYGDVFISSASGHNIDIFNLFLEYGVYKKYYVRALQHAKTNSHNPGTKKTIPILTKLIEETTNESLRDKLKGKSNDEINIELDKHQYNLMGKFNKACEYGLLNVVRDMLKNTNINPSANANLSLRLAIEGNHNEIVKELLKDRRVDPSSMNNTPISTSSLNNNLELVKILMKDKRVDPSYNNNILIGMVSRFGFLDIVKELLKDKRVDPSIDNNYALRWSKIKGYEEVAQYLEEHIKKNNK